MASEQEKEELMATLKFTPRNYRVEIWGYGGEVYWDKVDRKIYDFFKEKAIDIEQYASSWEERMWDDVPFEMRPFEPGTPDECDRGGHTAGATFDDASHITVYDENGKEVWSSPLGPVLKDNGATFDCIDEHYIADYPTGTVVFWGGQGEKGTFFGNEFELTAPFDPSKLRVLYEDMDGWELTSGVQYDGEDLDGNDYDTNGKWGENKWIIVGNTEEVYAGEERNEDDYTDEDDEEDEDELINLLKSINADDIGHSGGSLMDHLLRTYWLLKKLGADENICLVGGLHSVYGTNFFTAECLDKNKSTVVADTFGEEIDRLVKLFSSLSRPNEIETNTRGLSDNDYLIMRIVEIANLLDQGGIEEEDNPNLLAFYKETFNISGE